MRATILRMLASTSLAAFSASNIGPVPGQSGGPVRTMPRPAAPQAPLEAAPGGLSPMPSAILPRGSLLNLSV
jgi:hypothetical protein